MSLYITFDGGSGVGKGTLIEWCRKYFSAQGKSVLVLEDNKLDPLRDIGAQMLPWCAKNNVNRRDFLESLFAAGYTLSEARLLEARSRHDVILRDRSFISSLGYVPAAGRFDQEQVWNLYVEHLKISIPDIAVIVDADVDVAAARTVRRTQNDRGLGGKMSDDHAHRSKIRRNFLAIPNTFSGRLNAVVVENSGEHIDDVDALNALNAALYQAVGKIVKFCKETGAIT